MKRTSILRVLGLTLSLLATACTSVGRTLSIDIQTDLVAGPEFDLAVVEVLPAGAGRGTGGEILRSQVRTLGLGDVESLRRGLRAADFGGTEDGHYVVRVRLLRPPRGARGLLAEQWTSVEVRGATRVLVPMDAACVSQPCPAPGGSPAFSECVAGQCADTECDPADPTTWAEHCCDPSDPARDCPREILFCGSDTDCADPGPCSHATCVMGLCVSVPDEGGCGPGEYCASEGGCQPLPTAPAPARLDAGSDGGDAGAQCAAVPCLDPERPCALHVRDCVTGVCEPYVNLVVGTSCGDNGVCSSDGDCVTCPEAPLCDPRSDIDSDGLPDRADTETCDDQDNDGDGVVDEGVLRTMRHRDVDRDGFGVEVATPACAGAAGWAERGEDCDDSNPRVHPSAAEACNAIDDDCDGRIDSLDRTSDDLCTPGLPCVSGECRPRVLSATTELNTAVVTTVEVPETRDVVLTTLTPSREEEVFATAVVRRDASGREVWGTRMVGRGVYVTDLVIDGDHVFAIGTLRNGTTGLCGLTGHAVTGGDGGSGYVVALDLATGACLGGALLESTAGFVLPLSLAVRRAGAVRTLVVSGWGVGTVFGAVAPSRDASHIVVALTEQGGRFAALWARYFRTTLEARRIQVALGADHLHVALTWDGSFPETLGMPLMPIGAGDLVLLELDAATGATRGGRVWGDATDEAVEDLHRIDDALYLVALRSVYAPLEAERLEPLSLERTTSVRTVTKLSGLTPVWTVGLGGPRSVGEDETGLFTERIALRGGQLIAAGHSESGVELMGVGLADGSTRFRRRFSCSDCWLGGFGSPSAELSLWITATGPVTTFGALLPSPAMGELASIQVTLGELP